MGTFFSPPDGADSALVGCSVARRALATRSRRAAFVGCGEGSMHPCGQALAIAALGSTRGMPVASSALQKSLRKLTERKAPDYIATDYADDALDDGTGVIASRCASDLARRGPWRERPSAEDVLARLGDGGMRQQH